MTDRFNERDLVDTHTYNQQRFAEVDGQLASMHQTISYQETELTQKFDLLCQGCPPDTLQQIKQEMLEGLENFKKQLAEKEELLAQARQNEEEHFQHLYELLSLL